MSNLSSLDLEKMVSSQFGVDIFSSKTGSDADVCVLSFRVKGQSAAKDLSHFLEKEGDWIMDSDVSTGEDNTGKYLVFAEIKRNHRLADRIADVLEITERLTGSMKWKFSVGKKLRIHLATLENLEKLIPSSPEQYEESLHQEKLEELREFFDGAPYNTVVLDNNQLSLQQYFQEHKLHSALNFTVISENPIQEDLAIRSPGILNTTASWLGRMLGPEITLEEVGSNFLLTNSKLNKSLLVTFNV